MSANLHGLAAKIRAATESETFDLGNLPEATIQQVIQDAFGTDWSYDAIAALKGGSDDQVMIRITLVVGAGKQQRQKYSDSTPKVVTSALNAAKYQEDRGASCVPECAGLYKLQHDTGKNLKTVVVFPRFSQDSLTSSDSNSKSSTGSSLLPPESSTEYKALICSMVVFENMLKFKTPSWFQKRNLSQYLEEDILHGSLQECDALLLKGQVLSSDQQIFYDACVDISAKHNAVKQAMQHQVEEGQLTEPEKEFLLEQVAHRIEELQSSGNATALAKAKQRQSKLQSIKPLELPPLKHHVALAKLWKQAAPLLHLQTKQNQQHLTLAETKKLGQLEDILAEIDEREQDSQGWMEDDEVFETRIQAYRRELQQKYGSSSNKNGGGSNNKTSGGSKKGANVTANTRVQLPRAGGVGWMSAKDKKAQAIQSKKNRLKKGDVFGAAAAVMMMEDDDDDDESSGDDSIQEKSAPVSSSGNTAKTASNGNQSSISNKRKKKKNGGKKGGGSGGKDDDAVLNAAILRNRKATKKSDEQATKQQDDDTKGFLSMIIGLIMAILAWLASLVFGSSSKTGKKKKRS